MGLTFLINSCLYILIQLDLINARTINYNNNHHGDFIDNVEYSPATKELKLSNFTANTLDLKAIVEKFPNLETIFVENTEVSTVIPPENNNTIKELVLQNLKIKRIQRNFVLHFPALKILRLEQNSLSEISDHFYTGTLEELYIKNNRWNCSRDLSWVIHLNGTGVVKDLVNTTCKDKKFIGKSVLLIAQFKKVKHDFGDVYVIHFKANQSYSNLPGIQRRVTDLKGYTQSPCDVVLESRKHTSLLKEKFNIMKENCTKTCECSLDYIFQDPRINKQVPIIMVNCSGRGLTELPNPLPLNARILHLENNKISNIKALKTNTSYRQVWDLYLDNNTIESISYLEGSYWLSHFRRFSLRGNKLVKLPSYALDNALMKNPNMPKAVRLFLGGNPWKCDCIFTPVFQELVLQKYSFQIDDLRDVKCSYVRGDENSLKTIINLSRSSVCIVPTDFSLQEGLDLLNAVLASLIVFILGKLAYDYYHFKKSGKLPWIVSKMP